jgi:hypothetical protein
MTHRHKGGATVVAVLLFGAFPAARADEPPAPDKDKLPAILRAKPVQPGPRDGALRKLLVARFNAAVAEVQSLHEEYTAGRIRVDEMFDAARRGLDSGQELYERPADRLRLFEQSLEVAREVERIAEARHGGGKSPASERERARYHRLDAEIRVLRNRQDPSKRP